MANETVLLEIRGLTKHYPGVTALNKVNFKLRAGEVHALIGENGAGKSTLIKALMGIVVPDEGEFIIDGESVTIDNPQKAADLGISAVFQELSLIPSLSVAENIYLNKEGKKAKRFLNRKELYAKAQQVMDQYHIDMLDPREVISSLSAAKKQMAEIVKAVAIRPRILIFDEPTSSLTETETAKLFEIIRILRSEGLGIIYISHRMKELEILADRISVLRDGEYIGTREMKDTSMDEIIQMMVGRSLDLYTENRRSLDYASLDKVLEVRNITQSGRFSNVSFDLYKGEVLGIAGLVGSGRTELMNVLFGIDRAETCDILMNGKPIRIRSVKDAMNHGIVMVPESRHVEGLVLIHSIADNISLPITDRFQKGPFLDHKAKNRFASEMIDKYAVKTDTPEKLAGELSGGNQQKVVIAKWLSTDPTILIIDEPTIGIDVHSKVEIHNIIHELTKQGVSVIMISSEMQELLGNSDRILVMNNFKILGSYQQITQEQIMKLIMEDNNQERRREK